MGAPHCLQNRPWTGAPHAVQKFCPVGGGGGMIGSHASAGVAGTGWPAVMPAGVPPAFIAGAVVRKTSLRSLVPSSAALMTSRMVVGVTGWPFTDKSVSPAFVTPLSGDLGVTAWTVQVPFLKIY